MRKLVLIGLFLMGISIVSFAQGGGNYQKSPAERAAALKTSLALNDEQTAKITAIYTGQSKSMDSLKKVDNGDVGAMMKKMVPVIMTTNDKIKAVLTPDQAAIFQKQVDAQTAMMKQMMGN